MGRGIAALAASAGVDVVAASSRPGRADDVRSRFEADRQRLAKRRGDESTAHYERITAVDSLADAPPCSVIVESIVEVLETKRAVLKTLSEIAGDETIIGTNTSSLPLEALSPSVRIPERFVALHFFNPPTKMTLVEVAPGPETSEETLVRSEEFCRAIGQSPIRVAGVPGYLVNRLLVPQLLHAMATFEAGVASIGAIDESLKLGASHPMGPLALADYIGLDIVQAMARTLRDALDDARFDAPPILARMVNDGNLGKKSGCGFYVYEGRNASPNPALA